MKTSKQKKYKISAAVLTAAVLAAGALSFAPNAIELPTRATLGNATAATAAEKTVKKSPVDGNYYFADYDTAQDAFAAGDRLNKELIAEGATLLKNENSLPLKAGARVSIFGNRSARDLRYGGAGSGAGSGGSKITLAQSLERAGLAVNGALTAFYNDNGKSGAPGGNLGSYNVFAGPQNGFETPVAKLKQHVAESSYSDYGDAAIIVISRAGS